MNQSAINSEWINELDSNAGKVGMLVQPRHVTPGLRKPYEWVLDGHEIDTLVFALRGIANARKSVLQCTLVEAKRMAFGRRINIYLLGYRPGFCGDSTGITEEQWNLATYAVWLALKVLPDAKPFIQAWSAEQKFSLRFEAYIADNRLIKK